MITGAQIRPAASCSGGGRSGLRNAPRCTQLSCGGPRASTASPRYRVPGRPHSRRPGAVRDRFHERRRARREVDGAEAAQGRKVITGQRIKAARELLGWTRYRLAPRAGIGHTLLRQFEAGARVPDEASAGRLRAALEEAGVIFTADGVKLGRNLRGGRVPKQLNADKDG